MLIVGGDSFCCWPLEELTKSRNNCWPALVEEQTKLKVIDYSKSGCSNDRIFRYCMPETLNQQNKFLIIFWSAYSRFEIGYKGKIEQIQPSIKSGSVSKDFILKNYDLYLQHCKSLLYQVSIQESCKNNKITFFQQNVFKHDNWWDETYESFCNFMKKSNLFDYLSDKQLNEKYRYLEVLYSKIDYNTYIGNKNESISEIVECSKEFFDHPTYKGHKQMSNLVITAINKVKL